VARGQIVQNAEEMQFSQRLGANNHGLCGACVHARIIESDRGSAFVRCELSFTDMRFEKYPRLPVLRCTGYAKDEERSFS
jgi:hypothetical protein